MATNALVSTLHKTSIDLPESARDQLVRLLNASLADAADLQSQVKVAHWNVKGINFFQLHELFDDIAENVEGHVDLIAERITALGGVARGSVRDAARNSRLPEYPDDIHDGKSHVSALVDRAAGYAHNIRLAIQESDTIGDPTTNDMYIEISRSIEKDLWFLEAHLQA